MLILLTLSFLPANNRTTNTSDIIRNVSYVVSKKQFGIPPPITETRQLRSNDTPESDSDDELFHNTHEVRIVEQAPGLERDVYSSTNNTVTRLVEGATIQTNNNRSVPNMVVNVPVLNYAPDSKKRFSILSMTHPGIGLPPAYHVPIIDTLHNHDQNLMNFPHVLSKVSRTRKPSQRRLPGALARTSLVPGDILNGDVLIQKQWPKKDPYILGLTKQMQSMNTGYLSVAFEELCEIFSFKRPDHVLEIVKETDSIIEELMFKRARLHWLGEPMTTILRDVAMIISEEPVDEMQTRAMILKSLMRDRRQIVGADVNVALDLADDLINQEDGEHLFTVIHELKKYPNGTNTGKEICRKVIEAFEDPFLHISSSLALKGMVKNANQAFIDRFPNYSNVRTGRGGSRPTLNQDHTTLKPQSHSNIKRLHNLKHLMKIPAQSTVGKAHKHTRNHKTKRPHRVSNTRRRKHEPFRPDILLGR